MKKTIIIFLIISAFYAGCVTAGNDTPRNNPVIQFYQKMILKAEQDYRVWKVDGGGTWILFYGKNNNFKEVSGRKEGHGLSTGGFQFIYYRNLSGLDNLKSVSIMAMRKGNPDHRWNFSIEDREGRVLYQSPQYKFSQFSENYFAYREFPAAVQDIPDNFFIKIYTGSMENEELAIMLFSSEQADVFSFNYYFDNNPLETDRNNYAVFPEFN